MNTNPDKLSIILSQGRKLTKWKQEPNLVDLKNDFLNAKQAQVGHLARIQQWRNLYDCTGSEKVQAIKGRSQVQPKLVRKQAEWRYSALTEPFLAADKLFSIHPVSFEDKQAARQNELVLNWQFRTKIDRVRFIDQYIRAAVDEGTVIVRIGWSRQTRKIKEHVPVWEHYPIDQYVQMLAPKIMQEMGGESLQAPEVQALSQVDPMAQQMHQEMQSGIQQELEETKNQFLQTLEEAAELKESNPLSYKMTVPEDVKAAVDFYLEAGIPNVAIQVGAQEEESEKIIENRPVVEVLAPDNVYIDPSCNGDLDKALYVITSFESNKSELEKQGRYKNLDSVNWESTVDPEHKTNTPLGYKVSGTNRQRIVVYEYWGYFDIEGSGELKPIVASWIGNTLIRLELNPFPDEKLPFVIVPYSPVKRELYGEPDAVLLGDNQRILGAITRGMIDLLGRSANAQQGFQKGMLDPVNKRRYEEGQDYEFNQGNNPNIGIIEHKYPEIPSSALTMMQLQNNEAEALTGIKAFSGGLNSSAYGEVATGIKGVLDSAGKREMAILRRLAQGIVQIGQKIIAMNYEFLSEEEVIRVTNEEFVLVQREDLKGNFDLDVDIATIEVDNSKAQDLGFMLQTIGPNMDSQVSMTILAEIAELKRMPDLAETLRTWRPNVDPELEELQKEQARLQVELIRSQVDLNQAQAQRALMEADKKAVETQDNVSGNAHAKNIDLAQAQARGNQDLAVTRALTQKRKLDEAPGEIEAAIGYNRLVDQIQQERLNTVSQNIKEPIRPPPEPQMAQGNINPEDIPMTPEGYVGGGGYNV